MSALDQLPSTRREIVVTLKQRGPSTTGDLARALRTTTEGMRQQVKQLQAQGLVEQGHARDEMTAKGGRPSHLWRLTPAGEHLFPKRYADLATVLIDTVGAELGRAALLRVLDAAVEARVAAWRHRLVGRETLHERLDALRSIYIDGDPWVELVEQDGETLLVERNCPYLDVAMRRPALCSTTVHVLARLLGHRVQRVARFQNGDGCCAFRALDEPLAPDAPFELEPPEPGTG